MTLTDRGIDGVMTRDTSPASPADDCEKDDGDEPVVTGSTWAGGFRFSPRRRPAEPYPTTHERNPA